MLLAFRKTLSEKEKTFSGKQLFKISIFENFLRWNKTIPHLLGPGKLFTRSEEIQVYVLKRKSLPNLVIMNRYKSIVHRPQLKKIPWKSISIRWGIDSSVINTMRAKLRFTIHFAMGMFILRSVFFRRISSI